MPGTGLNLQHLLTMEKLTVAITVYHSTTPGPWGVYRGGTGSSAFGGELVALFNTEEDARMFAAASDMLTDLTNARRIINEYIDAHQDGSDEVSTYNALTRFVAPSIAKATGQCS